MIIVFKFLGSFVILGTSVYTSSLLTRTYDGRLRELRLLYHLLLQLKSEMKYMCLTLPECFEEIGRTAKEPFGQWFRRLQKELTARDARMFTDIWKENLAWLYKNSYLQKEDISTLECLSEKLGCQDSELQMKSIDYILGELEQNRQTVEKVLKNEKKIVTTLSIFMGFITMILLL